MPTPPSAAGDPRPFQNPITDPGAPPFNPSGQSARRRRGGGFTRRGVLKAGGYGLASATVLSAPLIADALTGQHVSDAFANLIKDEPQPAAPPTPTDPPEAKSLRSANLPGMQPIEVFATAAMFPNDEEGILLLSKPGLAGTVKAYFAAAGKGTGLKSLVDPETGEPFKNSAKATATTIKYRDLHVAKTGEPQDLRIVLASTDDPRQWSDSNAAILPGTVQVGNALNPKGTAFVDAAFGDQIVMRVSGGGETPTFDTFEKSTLLTADVAKNALSETRGLTG